MSWRDAIGQIVGGSSTSKEHEEPEPKEEPIRAVKQYRKPIGPEREKPPKATKMYSKPIGPEPVSRDTSHYHMIERDPFPLSFPNPIVHPNQYAEPIGPRKQSFRDIVGGAMGNARATGRKILDVRDELYGFNQPTQKGPRAHVPQFDSADFFPSNNPLFSSGSKPRSNKHGKKGNKSKHSRGFEDPYYIPDDIGRFF